MVVGRIEPVHRGGTIAFFKVQAGMRAGGLRALRTAKYFWYCGCYLLGSQVGTM